MQEGCWRHLGIICSVEISRKDLAGFRLSNIILDIIVTNSASGSSVGVKEFRRMPSFETFVRANLNCFVFDVIQDDLLLFLRKLFGKVKILNEEMRSQAVFAGDYHVVTLVGRKN